MSLTWNDLTIKFDHIERESLIEDWQWLVGSALPILISSVGDAFLQTESGEIHWLITGSGELEKVADSYEDFQSKLQDNKLVNEWFLVPVVAKLKSLGVNLVDGKLYGFKQFPVLGGEYEAENYELTDIEVYFSMSGQIHYQIKDIPAGAQVNFTMTEA
ncbi:T6SS immunity protein Tdi1 domain-containing protein [Photobacterium kasasachensis]|uniref:T6SS immunity protein Tdi1 domain-containing protein n=1 Tax=Photobacterium kasasachensis TaxID=2910240 RepID=UPI003D14A4BC